MGGKKFTKLDLSTAYQQLRLDAESKVLDSIKEVYVYVACILIIFIANQSPQLGKLCMVRK